jgi:hypothetical protein
MSNKAPRTAKSRKSWTSSHLDGSTADEHQSAPVLRRLLRDARLWLTVAAVVVGSGVLAAAIVRQGEQAAARQQEANRWHAHTLEVLVEVGRFSAALSETQRGVRGYLLTGDPVFAAGYRAGAQATPDRLRRMRALTADNPAQQRRLAALASETAALLDLSRREVELEARGVTKRRSRSSEPGSRTTRWRRRRRPAPPSWPRKSACSRSAARPPRGRRPARRASPSLWRFSEPDS